MSLVWHIVGKDFRRLRLPLAIWLGLTLAHTALLLADAGGALATPPEFDGWRYFTNTWGVIWSIVGFVLAAWLVLEDSLVTTKAFWPTRPISGVRLLAAKALGALLMFSVAPVLVMTPVWVGCGFSPGEWGLAAGRLALAQGILSVAAFVIASVTATSGQFFARAVGAAAVLLFGVAFVLGATEPTTEPLGMGVIISRFGLAWVLVLVTPLVLIAHQYLTRRTNRTWVLGGIALVLLLGVRFAWPWDISGVFPENFRSTGTEGAVTRGIGLEIRRANIAQPSMPSAKRQVCHLEGTLSGIPAGTYLRLNPSMGEWVMGGDREPFFRRLRGFTGTGERPPEHVVRQLAGLPAEDRPVEPWLLEGEELSARIKAARDAGKTVAVGMNLSLMRGRVLGELPLRVGAELQAGACHTRIISIVRSEGKFLVRLEDRDARPRSVPTGELAGLPDPAVRLAEDGFVLLNRPLGVGHVMDAHAIGGVQIHSIFSGQRQLVLDPPTREVDGRSEEIPGWEDGAVIVLVRFEPEINFVRPLAVNPFVP